VRGQQPSTAELRGKTKEFARPWPLRQPGVTISQRNKKGSRFRLPF